MNFKRLALAATICLSGACVQAQDFPAGKVEYIIPFGPGGESDITARLQQPFFEDKYGEKLVVFYQPGGGGAVGWSRLNTFDGDGSKVMGVNLPHIVIKPKQGNVGFETEDISTVYWFHYTPDALIVRADSSYQTLQDLIDDAEANPKKIIFSGSGKGTANHLAAIRFDELAGVQTTYISFKGTGAAVTALLGEQVTAEWGYTTVGKAQGEKVRLLAVAMEERHPAFPDVPTFKELGYNMVSGAYRGVAVPSEASEDMRRQVSDAIATINADPEFQRKMIEAGFALIDIPYGYQMDLFMKEKAAEYISLARTAGLIE